MLKRNISAATGVIASIAPAASPAGAPNQRRTAANRSQTAPTPSSACGTSMLQLENPNTLPDRAITQREAGGLSTVMKDEESSEPKKKAFQLRVAAWTAAA